MRNFFFQLSSVMSCLDFLRKKLHEMHPYTRTFIFRLLYSLVSVVGGVFSRARIYSTLRERKRGRDALMGTVTKHAFPEKHAENISNARSPGSNRGERKFRFATNSKLKVANQHISGKNPCGN